MKVAIHVRDNDDHIFFFNRGTIHGSFIFAIDLCWLRRGLRRGRGLCELCTNPARAVLRLDFVEDESGLILPLCRLHAKSVDIEMLTLSTKWE